MVDIEMGDIPQHGIDLGEADAAIAVWRRHLADLLRRQQVRPLDLDPRDVEAGAVAAAGGQSAVFRLRATARCGLPKGIQPLPLRLLLLAAVEVVGRRLRVGRGDSPYEGSPGNQKISNFYGHL